MPAAHDRHNTLRQAAGRRVSNHRVNNTVCVRIRSQALFSACVRDSGNKDTAEPPSPKQLRVDDTNVPEYMGAAI